MLVGLHPTKASPQEQPQLLHLLYLPRILQAEHLPQARVQCPNRSRPSARRVRRWLLPQPHILQQPALLHPRLSKKATTRRQPRSVVLTELSRIWADKFCAEVILKMRSAGRILLASSVVFPAFERVSLMLSTSSDPTKLIILDCAEQVRHVEQRIAFGIALANRLVPNGGAGQGKSRPAPRSRHSLSPDESEKNLDGKSGDTLAAATRSESDDNTEGSRSGGHDGSSRTGQRKAKPAEETNKTSGGKSGNQASSAQFEGPSVDSAGADVRSLLGARSLHLSLLNNGRLLPDARRQKETVTSMMLEGFLTLSWMPDLGALSFAMCNGSWAVAQEGLNEMVAASGVSRDWRSLCPTELLEKNWAEVGDAADITRRRQDVPLPSAPLPW